MKHDDRQLYYIWFVRCFWKFFIRKQNDLLLWKLQTNFAHMLKQKKKCYCWFVFAKNLVLIKDWNFAFNHQHETSKSQSQREKKTWRNSICSRNARYKQWNHYVFFYDDHKKKTIWNHEFIEDNSQLKFIKTLYFDLRHIISNVKYLSQRVILVIIDKNVEIINNHYINRFRDFVVQKWNSNRVVDLEMIEKFSFECFHHYDEIFLSSHEVRNKIVWKTFIVWVSLTFESFAKTSFLMQNWI